MEQNLFKSKGKVREREREILWLTSIFCLTFFIIAAPSGLFAQEKYPVRAINFIVGHPPGGLADICARSLSGIASKDLGQPMVVVNKPGAATTLAMTVLKSEKPDGYTIGWLTVGGVLIQHLRKVSFDTAKDFTPIVQTGIYIFGLVVRSDSPWKTFNEFINYARANPGKIRYSTAGPGTSQHLVMERLATEEKIKWTHVPFNGEVPSIAALLGGHVEACSNASGWKKHVQAGTLRLLAVYTDKRIGSFPEVPTLLELGYKIVAPSFGAIIAPKGLSPEVTETLHQTFKKALEDPEYIRLSKEIDFPVVYLPPQELGKFLVEMNQEWGRWIRNHGLRLE